jgi:23S rRNA (adenine2503-C2)-methyltransferase
MPAEPHKRSVFDVTFPEFQIYFSEIWEPEFRAKQVWDGVYKQLHNNAESLTTLPSQLRKKLSADFEFTSLTPVAQLQSKDGKTSKTLFELGDGARIETVLMRYKDRNTLCISSQVGCAAGCAFCATGGMGFSRNLTSGEIIEQVVYFERLLRTENKKLTNIVVMGMGEPFFNYENVLNAIWIMNDPSGFNMGQRRFTISTVGIVPQIIKFTELDSQVNLAISLHAATDELRNTLIPINRKYPLQKLIAVCREYTNRTRRRISFEWAMIENVNDTEEQADALKSHLEGVIAHVNLIPLNPVKSFSQRPSPIKKIQRFAALLDSRSINYTIRASMGRDIQAGCGQLAAEQSKRQ